MMASKISDREYVLRLLVMLEGKTNGIKAQKIATLLGGRIRQRLMNYGKIPGENSVVLPDGETTREPRMGR